MSKWAVAKNGDLWDVYQFIDDKSKRIWDSYETEEEALAMAEALNGAREDIWNLAEKI